MKQYKILGNDPYQYFPKDTVVVETGERYVDDSGGIIGTFVDNTGRSQFVDVSDVVEIGVVS